MTTILVVDDAASVIESLRAILKDKYNIIGAQSGREALMVLDEEHVDLIILDLRMPGMGGMEFLRRLQLSSQGIGVVVLTAVKDVQSIIDAVKLGALDYIVKPFEVEEIKITIEKALKYKRLTREVNYLRSEYSKAYSLERIIHGHSRVMEETIDIISRLSRLDTSVIIRGECGTGKELVARAIHFHSGRRENPFVVVSCPNLSGDLLESELFGHERGAFTGAYERRLGKFEVADGGTIFLDEVSEISLSLQAKLLRVLQDKEFCRVGGHSVIKANVRIITATNKDLEAMIKEGSFREDLYYRINVVPIYLPPLRERPEDIPQLVEHFYNIFRKECYAKTKFISREAIEQLEEYSWPGNVRELKNVIERTIALYGNEPILVPKHFPPEITGIPLSLQKSNPSRNGCTSLEEAVARVEKRLIEQAIQEAGGIKSRAAELLGTTRRILDYKMQKHGITTDGG
ncbi:MAG: Fis family transcriptional regulator [Planctomycetes bacterium GWA2_40_7]|nr:MAG: Fis family transcriptional regulator [Planctomycetes bacterium GWA2_40_7]